MTPDFTMDDDGNVRRAPTPDARTELECAPCRGDDTAEVEYLEGYDPQPYDRTRIFSATTGPDGQPRIGPAREPGQFVACCPSCSRWWSVDPAALDEDQLGGRP